MPVSTTELSRGDIAIIGLKADNPDDFAFVALTDLAAGTEIYFTDNGVLADGSFRDNEGTLKWTAPADVAAGSVITFTGNTADFTAQSGSFAFSASGDQLVAYKQTADGVEFLHAVHSNSTAWQDEATSSTNSALPAGLVDGETAVAAGSGAGDGDEFDNIFYTGPTAGDAATLLAAIGDAANWTGANSDVDYAVPTSMSVEGGEEPAEAAYTLELFHTSDQEGSISALEDAPRFSAVLAALRAQDLGEDGVEDNSILVGSGDSFIPGVFYDASTSVYGAPGRADILIQNELGFDAIGFGNHEFDNGPGAIRDQIVADGDYAGALYPYLSTNLDFSASADLADLEVAGGAAPQAGTVTSSVVIEKGGEQIGVIGAVTPTLDFISTAGDVGVLPEEFDGAPTDAQLDALAAVIQAEVDTLLADNPGLNKIVLVTHMQQIAIEEALATRLSGVDIISAGGSNTRLLDENDRPREGDDAQGTYPKFVDDADGNTTAIVNTDGNYKYVGRLVIDFDENGNIIADSYDADVSGAYATDAQGVADLGAEDLVDPEIQAISDALSEVIIAQDGNYFGVTEEFLNGSRGSVRIEETNLGNLTADANLAEARKTDDSVLVSIKNGGGIRDDIGERIVLTGETEATPLPPEGNELTGRPDGGISQIAIGNALAFNNELSILTVTRQELVDLLEHGIAASSPDDSNTQGRFPQVSGVQFSFDLTREPGDRIVSAAITDAEGNDLDVLVQNGEVVGDGSGTVRIVTLSYLADGGDGYPFPTGEATDRIDLVQEGVQDGAAQFADNGTEQDALAEYLAENYGEETPYTLADTDRAEDERIQNLAFREDGVIDETPVGPSSFLYVQDFEDQPTIGKFKESIYVDTQSGLEDHDLVNNDDQPIVDSENGVGLGFDASYATINSNWQNGMEDGARIGVVDYTNDREAQGARGYRMADTDGEMTLAFDAVDTSGAGEVTVSLDLYVNRTAWETNDRIVIEVETDTGVISLLDTTGVDINTLDLERKFTTIEAVVPAEANLATLKVKFVSNDKAEAIHVDNIRFEAIAPEPEPELPFDVETLDTVQLDGAEIVDFDPETDRAFVTASTGVSVVDASDPANLSFVTLIDPAANGADSSAVTSVSVANGVLAAAVPAADASQPGAVYFYDSASLEFLGKITVGALPDMLTFDESGDYLVVANEGEAGTVNPEGSVSVVAINADDLAASEVNTHRFGWDVTFDALKEKGVRVFGEGDWWAGTDLEPEYITIEGNKAFITLQEANAVAVIDDITQPGVIDLDHIQPLGAKDHSVEGNGLDTSDTDGAINIVTAPVQGLYMPDAIASYSVDGVTYYVTANEGDARDEDKRIEDLVLDPDAFPDAVALQAEDALGRLQVSGIDGDIDGDGDYDALYSYGARSFSIWDENGNQVFDSGDQIAKKIAELMPELHNSEGDADSFDGRSDNKGAEPEAVTIGQVGDQTLAFVGLERVGGVMVFDITSPDSVDYLTYLNTDGDIAPEGLTFVTAEDSPNGYAMLGVANEVSGTLTFYSLQSGDPVEPGDDFTLISEIQGEGAESTMQGEIVTIQAVVTGDFQSGLMGDKGELGGFWVQEEVTDYDLSDLTSEGIFIYEGNTAILDVMEGQLVEITGTVSEYFGKTQITATDVKVVQEEAIIPDSVSVDLNLDGVNLEALEGMLVNLPEVTVTEMYNLDRYGEMTVATERFAQYTQDNAPDAAGYAAHVAEVDAKSILIDDGISSQNPYKIRIPDGEDYTLTAADSFRMGDTLQNVEGVLDYGFNEYRLQSPTATHIESNPREAAPALDGDFKVASLNVLNYFTTLNSGDNTTTVGQDPRGANNAEELARQQQKIVNAIVEMDADVVGLLEIENDVTSAPLATLVDAINAELGSEVYSYINTGQVGTDAITNAVIYKTATANPVGDVDILDSEAFLDPLGSGRDLNRPAVTQSFAVVGTEETVTVSVNHLKSKGSLSGLAADEDQGDGAGNNNASRAASAEVLADHLAATYDGNTMIIGDLNSYAQEDPLNVLRDKGYTDLAYDALGTDSYSYVFDGQTGTLDYILASSDLMDNLTGVAEWHINADEADAIDYDLSIRNNSGNTIFAERDPSLYDGDIPERGSDHDPVIAAFTFDDDFVFV
ncbi:ExeM/NucH family extracellular endonuclease [Paracoccaceae bacterium GXU_MW_L88]